MRTPDVFDRQLASWGLSVGPGQRESLLAYARTLSRYDRANVIGTRDFDKILLEHVLDSLSCLLFAALRGADTVADVGSGGGLPGIPLAIMLPEARVTLIESTGKKAAFLRQAAEELKLPGVNVVNGRVEEEARQTTHRESYDFCTVRAVARLPVLAEYCLPLLGVGGYAVAMKGPMDEDEVGEGDLAAGRLGGIVAGDITVPFLPEIEQKERRLVLMQKISRTPDAYPRRVGTPARDPLGGK